VWAQTNGEWRMPPPAEPLHCSTSAPATSSTVADSVAPGCQATLPPRRQLRAGGSVQPPYERLHVPTLTVHLRHLPHLGTPAASHLPFPSRRCHLETWVIDHALQRWDCTWPFRPDTASGVPGWPKPKPQAVIALDHPDYALPAVSNCLPAIAPDKTRAPTPHHSPH